MAKEREQKQPQLPTKGEETAILKDLDERLNPKGITLKTWGRS